MNRFTRLILTATLLVGVPSALLEVRAQVPVTPLQMSQNDFLLTPTTNASPKSIPGINWLSVGGLPLSSVTNVAGGSSGRAPTPAVQLAFGGSTNLALYPTNAPTTNQFGGMVALGALTVQSTTNLIAGQTFAQNALNLGWPAAKDGNGRVVGLLRAAQVGAPYLNNLSSFPFGSVLPPPLVDETGNALLNGLNLTYWQTAPLGWQTSSNYYYSTNANAVFATQPGQATVVWQKVVPTNAVPPTGSLPQNFGYISNSFAYYLLFTNTYLVSGVPVKQPQNMYWTEGNYTSTGYPVSVPKAAVNAVNIIYNNNVPMNVASNNGDFAQTFAPYATNTIWFDSSLNILRADNVQGQVFVELLGEQLQGGRRFLGFEIVSISAAPTPIDINVKLGTRVGAYPDGTDDSQLIPAPLTGTGGFYYKQALPNGVVNLYATHLTLNQNDFQCYWLTKGVAGLRWPYFLDRYAEYWPANASDYVNYVRPYVATEAQAAATAVKLPPNEAPSIAYQDVFTNRSPAVLDSAGNFYTYLDLGHPAHRTLIQFLSGNNVSYERVFSWLDLALDTNSMYAGSVATNLNEWVTVTNAGIVSSSLVFTNPAIAPYVITNTVNVGNRIVAPAGELGASGSNYLAGYIVTGVGNSYNPNDYIDPFANGFAAANNGAIIPVNAIPGNNTLEVMWFRSDNANTALGFQPAYWPAVIGYYKIQWPSPSPNQIILANNAGSGPLNALANATVYAQNNPALPGYNPNEEHALILGGTAYALRDDLNQTNSPGYSSAPFVLIDYLASDMRPAMVAFQVRREAPEQGILFDYVVKAGTILQAPMPLPLMTPPIQGAGASAHNFNIAPAGTSGDLPANWNNLDPASALTNYGGFTFQDRKNNFWVYRGLHGGLPPLQVGKYAPATKTFGALTPATALVGSNFTYFLHVSRPVDGFNLAASPPLPGGLKLTGDTTNGLFIAGSPQAAGSNTYAISITDTDGSVATALLSLNIQTNGVVVAQPPLALTSSNQYSKATVTYSNRPPFLAAAPTVSNSFTMRFYYKNQAGFDWPGVAQAPTNGAIVPYLLPFDPKNGFAGEDPTLNTTLSLDVVYRPVWPALVNGRPIPSLYSGQTLTTPINGLAAIRGQSSALVLYQQSIATNDVTQPVPYQSVTLFDPTVEKKAYLPNYGLTNVSGGLLGVVPTSVVSSSYDGFYFFPNLPANLASRVWLDPNTTNLVLAGLFEQQTVGDNYIFLNVLKGADLAAVQSLCDPADPNYTFWTNAVGNLSTSLYTYGESTNGLGKGIPGTYAKKPWLTKSFGVDQIVRVDDTEQLVDSYALGATGPGLGYITYIVNNSINPTFSGNPVSVYVALVAEYQAGTNSPGLYPGGLVTVYDPNPLSESISFQHTLDLGGNTANYQYDWRIQPPMNGLTPTTDPSTWQSLTNLVNDLSHFTLGGGAGVQSLSDNFVAVRYRETDAQATPANTNWSVWTTPAFAPGYIKRVLTGINPFEQTISDLFNNPVNTVGNILTTAGSRWQGDVALNADTLASTGLIQIYETVLNRGKSLSINGSPPINYGPANDALLLAAGEISDLYSYVANDASVDAANPTISIGTDNKSYGSVATSLFAFQGQEPSLLEEELALLRGRDDSVTSVTVAPVFNRLYWNYTHGIADGEVIYALNYNILDENDDGKVNANDAAILYPMGHGDAYGHYLTALNNYYQLLTNPNFDWVPQPETVSILGASVAVNYQHERKFAASSGALAQTGLKVFDLTWREGYLPGTSQGWNCFDTVYTNPTPRIYLKGTNVQTVARYWGLDHWASRTAAGAYLNWVVGNAILPPTDPNVNDQGIQKVDRTTVPELGQLPQIASQLQADMNNAEAGFTPFNLAQNAIPFDINPLQVTGANPQTHFEQIYQRAVTALNNAVVAFNDAQSVTEQMRSQEDSLGDFQAGVVSQELAYNNQLIEIYGTPYPDDIGPGGGYPQGYNGPDLKHYTYVSVPNTNSFGGLLPDPQVAITNYVDIQALPTDWSTTMYSDFTKIIASTAPGYTDASKKYSTGLVMGPDGFFDKPQGWTSERRSPGQIQQAISTLLAAKDALRQAELNMVYDKQSLDNAQNAFNSLVLGNRTTLHDLNNANEGINLGLNTITAAYNIADRWLTSAAGDATDLANIVVQTIPVTFIAGVAAGGDLGAPARGALYAAALEAGGIITHIGDIAYTAYQVATGLGQAAISADNIVANNVSLDTDTKNAVQALGQQELALQGEVFTVDQKMRAVSDAQAAYNSLVAKGLRIQSDRATWRQHAAALVQGYRTRDAAFRLFQNEKLGRYLTLFNLAGEYSFLAAQAYDYETGLLGTSQGQAFLNQIISAQALGVVSGGVPQYSGGSSGDPGLAGALARMKGDWDVLKGRLGFNNPDGYGTTVSLRSENYRILSGTNGDPTWQQVLQGARVNDVTKDSDVKRLCLQIGDTSGNPVPGIILSFSTTITDGLNLFGNQLSSGDHAFSPSSFATKIFSVGVCLDGYIGMDNPAPGGAITPPDPTLNPNGLSATPYVYLIPVGQDFMRSPPLGDASAIRAWSVDDVAVPLPFNISASDFASHPFYNSASSLSEPLFGVREHQAFRPVSTTSVFNTSIYGAGGSLQPSEYTNKRLIGRSIWNSKWKLVIPGKTLLNDPNHGLDRFIQTVRDVKLYFITYSYSGN